MLPLIGNAHGHPRAVMEMFNRINVVFMPANSIHLQPMDQGVILTFKYYIRIHFIKLYIVAINSDFCNGARQSKLKTRSGVTILDAILNLCVSWEEVLKIKNQH